MRRRTVPRWQPQDFAFKSDERVANPFQVRFAAELRGPAGKAIMIPGFFDGNGTWKVRVSPTLEGEWSLETRSNVKELEGKTATFTCVTNKSKSAHGRLRVDRNNPHHFVFEDGTRFFLQGYEYDWLWALDMDKSAKVGVPTVKKSLDLIASHGFNYVILNTYAHDTSWRKGKSSSDDFGPSLLYPWEGANDAPDHSRMNLTYWQHYDKIIAALSERGIQAHLFLKVYNKQVKWPAIGSEDETLFLRWLIARYGAYPNVIWDFSKEAHNEKDLAYKQNLLKWLRESDPYRHLATVHDDDKANDAGAYDDLNDFRTDQQHSNFHAFILRQRERRAWPVVNVEFGYEHGPGGLTDKTYNVVQSPEEVVRRAWEIQMAGGYTAYYYTYTAWDVIRPLDIPPGYAYFKHFSDFWRTTQYWKLEPSDKLTSSGWCLAQAGREYVVFQNQAQSFALEIADVKGPLTGEWFNPHTGKRSPAGIFANGTASLTPPPSWGMVPLVLHLRSKELR